MSKRATKSTVVSKKETSEVSEEKSNEGMSNTFPIDSVVENKTEPLARPPVTEGKDYPHLASMITHTPDVLIELPNTVHEGVTIPATLVRARRCADGWYDVGALFRLPAVRQSAHEVCLP